MLSIFLKSCLYNAMQIKRDWEISVGGEHVKIIYSSLMAMWEKQLCFAISHGLESHLSASNIMHTSSPPQYQSIVEILTG